MASTTHFQVNANDVLLSTFSRPAAIGASLSSLTSLVPFAPSNLEEHKQNVAANLQQPPSPRALKALSGHAESFTYHLHTLWLFIASDVKTIVPIWLLFAFAHAISLSQFGFPSVSLTAVLIRTPTILTWILLNLLPGCIGNQTTPLSILEDTANKPWRPIPSCRISAPVAKTVQLACNVMAFTFSLIYGGLVPHLLIWALWHIYNDYGGGSRNCLVRNLMNGFGIMAFGYGALEMAVGPSSSPMSWTLALWLGALTLSIASTSHVQDLKDQEGDAAAGRNTVPIVYGDAAARWSMVVALVVSTTGCCLLQASSLTACVGPVATMAVMIYRLLSAAGPCADKKTYMLWIGWLLSLFVIPAFNSGLKA